VTRVMRPAHRRHPRGMAGTAAWVLEKELRGHTAGVTGCAWSPDGSKLASSSGDKTVRVWDVGDAREVTKLEGHTRGVLCCTWSPDGTRVASSSADNILE